MGRVDLACWPHLEEFVAAAIRLELRAWLFGSALTKRRPRDLDVLILYIDRPSVVALRSQASWTDCDPPLDVIAMTTDEERHYRFIDQCSAVEIT